LANIGVTSWWPSDWITILITTVLCDVVIPVIWFCAAVILLMVQLQAAFCLALGPIVVAFSGMEISFNILVDWIWGLVGLALKIVAVVLVLTEGVQLARNWIGSLAASGGTLGITAYDGLVLVSSLLLFYCVWKLPNIIEGYVGGSPSLGLGESIMGSIAGASSRAAASAATTGVSAVAKQVGESLKAIDDKLGSLKRGQA
jgi:hypothetical protein